MPEKIHVDFSGSLRLPTKALNNMASAGIECPDGTLYIEFTNPQSCGQVFARIVARVHGNERILYDGLFVDILQRITYV